MHVSTHNNVYLFVFLTYSSLSLAAEMLSPVLIAGGIAASVSAYSSVKKLLHLVNSQDNITNLRDSIATIILPLSQSTRRLYHQIDQTQLNNGLQDALTSLHRQINNQEPIHADPPITNTKQAETIIRNLDTQWRGWQLFYTNPPSDTSSTGKTNALTELVEMLQSARATSRHITLLDLENEKEEIATWNRICISLGFTLASWGGYALLYCLSY